MPGAFQNNAFQNSAFQVAPGISNIVNTTVLPNPLDAALGHYYEPTYKAVARITDEIKDPWRSR